MDEQYIIDLYNQLGGESKFGKFENFKSLITTDLSYQKDFHSAFGEGTLGSFDNFVSLVSSQPAASKKKEGGIWEGFVQSLTDPLRSQEQQESVSPSDQSSSVSQSPSFYSQLPQAGMQQGPPMRPADQMDQPVEQQGFVWDQPKTTLTASMQPVSKYEAEQKRLQEDKRLKKEAAENLLNWRETQALKIQEEEKKKEEEARLRAESLGISKTPEFVEKLNKIDNTLFYDEEKIKNLNEEFKDYGIVINKGGIFNNKLIARTEDGKASIEIDLTPDSEAQMVEETNKLRKFLNENNRVSQDEDFLSKALRAKKMRPSPMLPGSDFVAVGNKVIPTTFPKEIVPGMGALPFGEQFIKLPIEDALKEAKKRGELFTFKTPEEAQEFANGSWKDISQVDVEGDNFYKQRGRDYITEKRRWERYDELDDLINFFEGYDTKNEEEIKAENPNLFVNGKPRYDIKEIVAEFKKEREQLRPLVKDITFLNQEGTSEKMRMDFDSYLAKRENEIAAEATKTFREAQSDLSIINTESLKLFGVNINELTKNDKYKTQDPQAYNNLIQKYTDITQLAQTAGIKYADAKTYYDAKINKEINSDLTDNVEATVNALSDGFKNGLIGDQLLAMTIPGYDAWSGFKDKESAAKYISEKLSQMSQTQSRVMTRYGQSKTARDWWDVFLDDPFESMVLMAGQSISQALPYGVKIVPLITGYSALTGAAYGGATTGGAGVLPGFVGGGVFGLRTGQAVTGYATEYTNAIMEAVKNNGYDPLNPKSLEQALNDQKVWDEGAKVGAARGIPIAVVDYLTAGLAGKMIKPASKLATTTSKMSRAAAENILIDPTAEAAGELIAQGTEIALGTGRQALDWNEIGMEGIGGMGSNMPNYVLNTYLATKANTDINLAYNLTDVKKLAAENVSDERISNWANNMEKLGKIDASVNQRIQENIGLRRDAKEVLSVGGGSANSNVVARTMELLDAKKQLTATKNRQEVYSAEIKSINEELAAIGKTKKLAPVDQQTNLKGIIEEIPEAKREDVGEYMINNIRYTKQQFLDKINSFTPGRLLKSKIAVKGDPEVSQTFQQKVNAVQKQAAGEVPIQPEARVGEEVVQGEPTTGPEIVTQEGVTEEKPKEKIIELDLSSKSIDDLEKRQYEIEDSRNEEDKKEFNQIDKELEKREWQSILNSPIEDIEGVVDSLIEKEKKKPNGFGSYIESKDARETKEVARKYSGQVSKDEAKKDFKDSFFGNPSSQYADGLKMRESVRVFVEQGGTFKELLQSVQKEFESDGFSEQDAANVIKNKLNEVSRKNILEQPSSETITKEVISKEATPEIRTGVVPTTEANVEFTEQDRARQQELTDALAKADKRRKNMIVGETTMSKADVKAELDALNQKEQASQQPAPATETAPAETAPAERTPEQEADLLEELMSGKKKEPTTKEKGKSKKTSDRVRDLKIKGPGGLQSNVLGVPIAIWNAGVETAAKAIDAAQSITDFVKRNAAIKAAIKKGIKQIEKAYGSKINETLAEKKMLITMYSEPIKMAREEGIGNDGIKVYLERKGLSEDQIDTLLKYKERAEKKTSSKGIELSEDTLPGYTKLMNRIEGVIKRSMNRGVKFNDIMENVISNLENNSPEYANATDQQKEQIIRDIRALFGKKEKAAPSAKKITGAPAPKKVVVDDYKQLKREINLVNKSIKEGRKTVRDAVKEMVRLFKKSKVITKLTRSDLNKIIGLMDKVYDEASLQKAVGQMFDIILKSNEDIVEISNKKRLAQLSKAFYKGVRETKKDLKAKRAMLTEQIKKMSAEGVISLAKANIIIDKINKVNLDNPDMVQRLLDYIGKVFDDAEYDSKLTNANKLRSQIKQLSKNKTKFGNLTSFAAKFAQIDPSMVSDIDQYIAMALDVKEGVSGSKFTPDGVKPAAMLDINEANKYLEKTLEEQAETIKKRTADKIENLIGVDVSDLTYEKMLQLIDLIKREELEKDKDKKRELSDEINDAFGTNKDKETAIKSLLSKMFDTYSSIIESMFRTGIDPFADTTLPSENLEFKKSDIKLVREFMNMDLNLLSRTEALKAIDALNNFIVNKSTANMANVLASYNGKKNAETALKKGLKALTLRLYFNATIGRTYAEQFASVPLFFEKLFKGATKGAEMQELMGITSLVNHKAEAEALANRITMEYINEFNKKNPNGKKFLSLYNIIERGIIADLSKTINGTESQISDEFFRRKQLIQETIEILNKSGSKQEIQQAKVIKEVFDKIAKDAKTIEDVKKKADQINIDAVQFWINKWEGLYDEFADVALNVYNRVLDKSINYTPDRFSFLERAVDIKGLVDTGQSTFFANSNYFYKKEAGSLMKATPPSTLKKDGKANMYVNLSFDTNNVSALMDALIDIKTAADIRQIQAFTETQQFEELLPNAKDAAALKRRIDILVRNIRNKGQYVDPSFKEMIKNLDRIATWGAGLALGGFSQIPKQTLSVGVNTLINAGKLNISAIRNKDVNNFINNSGMAIANRGFDAVSELQSLDQKIEQAVDYPPAKFAKFLEDVNKAYLKIFLVNFDSMIARASWISYYEKSLKKQGISTKGIDYSTHEINQKAANYAQMMVDRQQNISDKDLAGALFTTTNPARQFIVKTAFPFASFRMNQTMRTMNDLTVLSSKSASREDKIIAGKSLVGFAAEMATFKAVSLGLSWTWYLLAQAIRGKEEDEEKRKKRWSNMVKGQATSAVSDVFSPIPVFDAPVKYIFNSMLDQMQNIINIDEEDRYSIFTEEKVNLAKSYGMYGIALDKFTKLAEVYQLAGTGVHTDVFRNKKYISPEDQNLIMASAVILTFVDLGLLPAPEITGVINNIIKTSTSEAKTKKQLEQQQTVKPSKPFLGMPEKEFKEKYPNEWRENYGPGTEYYQNKIIMERENKDLEKEMENEIKEMKREMDMIQREMDRESKYQ